MEEVDVEKHHSFQKDLEALINSYSVENESNTPDFILAQYINGCLTAFAEAVNAREKWYGRQFQGFDSSDVWFPSAGRKIEETVKAAGERVLVDWSVPRSKKA